MHVSQQHQANPTYFDDKGSLDKERQQTGRPGTRRTPSSLRLAALPPVPGSRGRLESSSDAETEVFLTPSQSPPRTSSAALGERERFRRNMSLSSSLPPVPRKSGPAFGRLTHFFWKSKSKNSVESTSDNSSTFTPDSWTSLDSDSHSSLQSGSPQAHDPASPFYMNEDFQTRSYDEGQSYYMNSYYNVQGDYGSRNNSSPTYYNTRDGSSFLTFPNPRRHSIASEGKQGSGSCAREGYVVPIQTQSTAGTLKKKQRNNLYVNADAKRNDLYVNDRAGAEEEYVPPTQDVKVEVHSPTPSTATSIETFSDVFNSSGGSGSLGPSRTLKSSSNDSSSTLVAGEGGSEAGTRDRSRAEYMSMIRLFQAGTDCEPYCSLCSSASVLTSDSSLSSSRSSKMDIAVISCKECFFSQRAEGHLKRFFENLVGADRQKLDITLQAYDVKDIEHHTTAATVHRAKVQIVIISNHFLDRLRHEATVRKKVSPVNRVLRSKRVIAILLSVSQDEISESYQNVLMRFPEWYTVELSSTSKLDGDFCKKFTEQVIKIYNLELSNTANFSIFPKKITKEQPKVMVLFKKPVEAGDRVRLDLARGRQTETLLEIMTTNPYSAMIRIPAALCEDRNALIEITAYVNNQKLGTKLIKYEHNSRSGEDDSIEKMILAVPGFKKVLDDHVSQQLSKNFRSCEDNTLDSSLELMNDVLISKGDDFPSPMHFAAYYGLEQTTWVLLYEGEGMDMVDVRNDVGETPVDIAQGRGFGLTIGQTIRDFVEITNTWGMCQVMKELYDRHSEELNLLNGEEAEGQSPAEVLYTNVPAPEAPAVTVEPSEAASEMGVLYTNLEVTEDEEGDDTVSMRAYGDRVTEPSMLKEAQTKRHSLHVHVPSPASRKNNQNQRKDSYANFCQNKTSQILQTYDIPPPPNPVPQALLAKPTGPNLNYYDIPRATVEDYCIPPANSRPVPPEKPSLSLKPPGSPVFMKKTESALIEINGYITVGHQQEIPSLGNSSSEYETESCSSSVASSNPKYPAIVPTVPGSFNTTPGNRVVLPHLPKQFQLDPTQEELLELMNDFKNNVYNMRELELLYENWRQRNDVQLDFRVRQKELKEIQKEYKKIQENIRKETKKPSPMERLLKFIPGSKKKISNAGLNTNTTSVSMTDDPSRKISGSSDRSSSQSGGSGPDSGVSDPDSEKDKITQEPVWRRVGEGGSTWRNPLDRRLVPSYVEPSEMDGAEPARKASMDNSDPPPRPLKKISLAAESPALSTSPPTSPSWMTKRLPPPPPIQDPVPPPPPISNKLIKKLSKGSKEPKPAPAPLPPPRTTKTPSPFSYINYKGRSKHGASKKVVEATEIQDRRSSSSSKNSYENEVVSESKTQL